MPAYVLLLPQQVSDDPRAMLPYQEQVEATMATFGGGYRTLMRHQVEVLEGDWKPPHGVVLLEFPDLERARAWYHSEGYAPLLAQRLEHMRCNTLLIDGLEAGVTLLSLGILSPSERARIEQIDGI